LETKQTLIISSSSSSSFHELGVINL